MLPPTGLMVPAVVRSMRVPILSIFDETQFNPSL